MSKEILGIEVLEKELKMKLQDYKSKKTLIQEVVPNDLDKLLTIVKNNPSEFGYDIRNIRERLCRVLETKIGER